MDAVSPLSPRDTVKKWVVVLWYMTMALPTLSCPQFMDRVYDFLGTSVVRDPQISPSTLIKGLASGFHALGDRAKIVAFMTDMDAFDAARSGTTFAFYRERAASLFRACEPMSMKDAMAYGVLPGTGVLPFVLPITTDMGIVPGRANEGRTQVIFQMTAPQRAKSLAWEDAEASDVATSESTIVEVELEAVDSSHGNYGDMPWFDGRVDTSAKQWTLTWQVRHASAGVGTAVCCADAVAVDAHKGKWASFVATLVHLFSQLLNAGIQPTEGFRVTGDISQKTALDALSVKVLGKDARGVDVVAPLAAASRGLLGVAVDGALLSQVKWYVVWRTAPLISAFPGCGLCRVVRDTPSTPPKVHGEASGIPACWATTRLGTSPIEWLRYGALHKNPGDKPMTWFATTFFRPLNDTTWSLFRPIWKSAILDDQRVLFDKTRTKQFLFAALCAANIIHMSTEDFCPLQWDWVKMPGREAFPFKGSSGQPFTFEQVDGKKERIELEKIVCELEAVAIHINEFMDLADASTVIESDQEEDDEEKFSDTFSLSEEAALTSPGKKSKGLVDKVVAPDSEVFFDTAVLEDPDVTDDAETEVVTETGTPDIGDEEDGGD